MSNKGQTAVVLIFMIAVALVIYSASLNWSRVTQFKALTTVGSNSAAAEMASMIASYGEQQMQVTLGGNLEVCKKTNFIVLLAALVITIVVIIYCTACAAGSWQLIAAYVGLTLAIAALAINLLVVEPGLTKIWNKMQQNLTLDRQVIEGAILTGLRAVINDPVTMYDHFDMDTDGQWVNAAGAGNVGGVGAQKDKLSRFSYYYTRRLQEYSQPLNPVLNQFIFDLKELLYDNPFNKLGPPPTGCTAAEQLAGDIKCQVSDNFGIYDPGCGKINPNEPKPYCDPCCQPEFQPDGVTPLRPSTCTLLDVAACGSGDYPVAAYEFQYDPFIEDYTNTFFSFREKLGIDDENPNYFRNQVNPNSPPPQGYLVSGFIPADATGHFTLAVQANLGIVGGTPDRRQGIFPFFWSMLDLKPAQDIPTPPPSVIALIYKTDNVIPMTADPLNCTITSCPNKIVTPPDMCALTDSFDTVTNRVKTDGFYWKPGSDEYCSNVYPYNDCIGRVGNCTEGASSGTGSLLDCGCSKGFPTEWHDDNFDELIYGIKQFIALSEILIKKDPDDLIKTFTTWYPEMAFWIAPKCAAGPLNVWCYNGINDGFLLFWRDTLGTWVDLIDTWLYKTSFANDNSWCLPTAATAAAQLLPIERNKIPSLNPTTLIPQDRNGVNIPLLWGDLNDTVACLNYNKNNLAKLTACKTTCVANPSSYTANANACLNLPRTALDFITTINLRNSSLIPAEVTAYNTAQQLQNCLDSTCQDTVGVLLPVCTGLPVAQPPNCVAWGPGNLYFDAVKTERDNQFNLSNYCEPSGAIIPLFQKNLDVVIATATQQEPEIIRRTTELAFLRDGAVNARATFLNAYKNFSAFLAPCAAGLKLGEGCNDCTAGGPAAKLICARKNLSGDALNFAIYAWQSKPVSGRGPTGTDPDKGYWHIVRSEAFAPQRCFNQCGTEVLPSIGTSVGWGDVPPGPPTPGIKRPGLNRIRCYRLQNVEGTVISRVTRYDEDHDSPGASLANGQALWKFRYTNPGVPSTTGPGNIAIDCRHPISYDDGLSVESKLALDGAFMINNNPRKDPVRVSGACFSTLTELLNRGVQSTTCARYYYDGDVKHMSLKFAPCVAAAVAAATSCAATGTCS